VNKEELIDAFAASHDNFLRAEVFAGTHADRAPEREE
jgi:hypothetical protein